MDTDASIEGFGGACTREGTGAAIEQDSGY